MGGGGATSGGTYVKIIHGKRGDLDTHVETPNTRYDLYVDGVKVQSRWYDFKGDAIRNRDYQHQDAHHNHTFPHDHAWIWENGRPHRIEDNLQPDYENYY